MTLIIDGKKHSKILREKILNEVLMLKKKNITPGLAVIIIGENPASKIYVKNKIMHTKEVGMKSFEYVLKETTSQDELLSLIYNLNRDTKIHGILCQLPLPKHILESEIINAIDYRKDVDGFHIKNVGLLNTNQKSLIPCTPQGCIILLKSYIKDLSGKNAVILGRSNIVGKPMNSLLLRENCTVTVVHSKTKEIKKITSKADIIIAAIGRANYIDKSWVKDGSIIIDVGINRVIDQSKIGQKTKIVGDVDFFDVKNKVNAITPVPGGVGPMTIACLLNNTLIACCRINSINETNLNLIF